MAPKNEAIVIREDEEGIFSRDVNGQLIPLDPVTEKEYSEMVTVTIDGRTIQVPKARPTTDSVGNVITDERGKTIPRATTIYDAASEVFVKRPGDVNPIPVLCHAEHMRPVAVCRVCSVQISRVVRGSRRTERKLLPACQHRVEDGMEVHTINSPDPKAQKAVRDSVGILTELLMSDHLHDAPRPDASVSMSISLVRPQALAMRNERNQLRQVADRLNIPNPRFQPSGHNRGRDKSSMVINVDHNLCILCDRCVRACDEIKENNVIGRTGKGFKAKIGFDLNDPMGESSCVQCGECMASCPTGALTFKEFVQPDPWKEESPVPQVVTAEELAKHPLFQGVSYQFLKWNEGSVVRRRFKKGDVLCTEGEYGSTAFLLLSGRYEISIRTPVQGVTKDKAGGLLGFLGKAAVHLTNKVNPVRLIRNDGSAALSAGRPVAVRQPPEDIIIGEMTCLSNYPRSATVTAMEDGEVWEILRNVLYILQRNKVSRDILDNAYRNRALDSHLQSVELFSILDDQQRAECVKFLRPRVKLVRVDPGQMIFRQGEPADHFYLVRIGFVKVSQKFFNSEVVLDYLGPGTHFGEVGLLSRVSEVVGRQADQLRGGSRGVRTANCAALDHVELVRISGDDFAELLKMYPQVRERLIDHVTKKLIAHKQQLESISTQQLDDFVNNGLYNAQNLLVLDLHKCTRCDECTKACADTHQGITRLIREGLRFDRFLVATSCRSCLDPYCMVGCPVGSIRRDGSKEIVIEDWCIGCGLCANNCPYGNIQIVDIQAGKKARPERKATTCDACREYDEPSCVYACPHDAAHRMTGQELKELVKQEK